MRKSVAASRKLDGGLIAVVLLSIFVWAPLLSPAYFLDAHDAPHSIWFLMEFDQAIRDGVWYPRWGTDFALGYGYPLFNLYSPLAFYLAELFHLLGASLTEAVKIAFGLGVVLSGVSMYLFVRRTLGPRAAFLAAVLYMYAPYRLVDIYVRTSYAEAMAFIFLPLILWAFWELAAKPGPRQLALAALAYAGLILTHNATALIFTPFLLAYLAFLLGSSWLREQRANRGAMMMRRVGYMAGAGLLALGISAIFWLPMAMELKYVVTEQWLQSSYDYHKQFVFPSQLFSPFWGYGYAGEGLQDEMSFQLGVVPCVLAVVTGLMSGLFSPQEKGAVRFLGIATLVIIAAMLPLSLGLWQAIPIAPFVQFPWRLLILTTLSLAILGGAFCALDRGRQASDSSLGPLALIFAVMAVLASSTYAVPEYTPPSPRSETPASIMDFELDTGFLGVTAWVEEKPTTSPLVEEYLEGRPLTKAVSLTPEASVEMIRHGGASEEIRVSSPHGAKIMFRTYFFPGWEGYVDGEKALLYPSGPQALITMDVPPGEHMVSLRWGGTPPRTAGTIISGAALLGALLSILWPVLARMRSKGIR